jgi:hypothetical protein
VDTSGGTSSSASKARSPRRARTPPSSDTPMPAKHPPPHAAERARGVPARSSRRPRTDHAVPPPWMARARPPSNTNLFLPRCHPVHHLPVNKQRRKRGRPPAGNQRRRDVNTGGRLPAPIRRCSVCPLLIREAGLWSSNDQSLWARSECAPGLRSRAPPHRTTSARATSTSAKSKRKH